MDREDPYDKLKNLPASLVERLKANRDARLAQDELAQKERVEEIGYQFGGSVHIVLRDENGRLSATPGDNGVIRQWRHLASGDIIYTFSGPQEPAPSKPQLTNLARTIQDQGVAFNALNPAEQAKIRSSQATNPGGQFSTYFRNETLRENFQRLNNPRPQR